MLGLEVAGLVVSASGAAVTVFFGKLFAAAVLGALALGFFLRLAGRRGLPPAEPLPTPPWIQFMCAFLAIVEVAVLTEATNLPVRLSQPDFEKTNWLLVLVALLTMYFIQLRFLRSVLVKPTPCRPGSSLSATSRQVNSQ